ncbi:kallikrein-4 [Cavia porcellus]|uniref:kallikrein-4 n=1 Tax=Cavia porcellus TaxID=10141 RepID=UPI002FE205AB
MAMTDVSIGVGGDLDSPIAWAVCVFSMAPHFLRFGGNGWEEVEGSLPWTALEAQPLPLGSGSGSGVPSSGAHGFPLLSAPEGGDSACAFFCPGLAQSLSMTGAGMMLTAGNPWSWILGYLMLGGTAPPREPWPRPHRLSPGPAHCSPALEIPNPVPCQPPTLPPPPGASYPGGHIIHGEDCIPHSQPWQAALLSDNELFCSGVLVHPQWVLSAAHCLLDSYSVGLGLHSLEASQEPGSRVLEPLLSVQHPDYDNPSFANDLMLIKLKEAVPESSTIRSISVASRCPMAGEECLVSGWGRLANGGLPKRLQCVNISVSPPEVCSEVYDSLYHYSMFCAGGGSNRRDSCHGDSGGPLVCNRSLQGLVSLGHIPCGQPGIPGVYTNLCKFTDWIQQTIHTS